MSVPLFFALLGGIILVGFFANLLFRLTRIPSVLLLIGIGVLLGPTTGLVQSSALRSIAPLFGALALLIILFEGGLELEIRHVVGEAPRTTLLAILVFGLSLASVGLFAHLVVGLALPNALLLGAILAATSPAICLPVVSGLRVRDEIKTIIKLESVLGEVLLVVSVVLLMDAHASGSADPLSWLWSLLRSFLVAMVVSSIAGVLWSRLVGWMGHEPLAYMLTLGIVCLLYVAVEELGGSPAIAILMFGLLLANMQAIAARFGPKFRELFGLDVREEQFVLNQFMVNITAELSFLVRTFFFVYLGLLLDIASLSWAIAGWALALFGLLLVSRGIGVGALRRGGSSLNASEASIVMALQPRGLATAVMALLPMQAGIAGSEVLPLFAFVIIILTNVYMTGGVLFAERRLRMEPAPGGETAPSQELSTSAPAPTGPPDVAAPPSATLPPRPVSIFSPASDFVDEPLPRTFTDWMARLFGLRLADREAEYVEMIRASYLSEPLFWVQTFLAAATCALGLILDQTAIVIGGALIVPLVRPVIATGLALASGDIYLLLKLLAKVLLGGGMVVALSALLIDVLPFGAATAEIAARTRPTVLDFLVALFGGMSGAALISLRRRVYHYLPGAVIGIALLPPLCVMGFGLGSELTAEVFRGSGLLFTANLVAAILGAGAVLLLVGIPQAADCQSIRSWKEQELSQPTVQAVFRRLGLQNVVGRTGSVRARLAVVAVFLLSVLTPLQLALNQLTGELRARQAVTRAQAMFEIPGRSVVLNSRSSIRDESVEVRIQVATNEPFTAADISRFQERVLDQSGKKTRLDLVQTLGDLGQADVMRGILVARNAQPEALPKTVAATVREAGTVASEALGNLPLPDGTRLLAVRSDLTGSPAPRLELVYLSQARLAPDASQMLATLAAERCDVARDQVVLRWLPALHRIPLGRGARLPDGERPPLAALRDALASHPALTAVLHPAPGMSGNATDAMRSRLSELLAVAEDRLAAASPASERGVIVIGLEMSASAAR